MGHGINHGINPTVSSRKSHTACARMYEVPCRMIPPKKYHKNRTFENI